MSCHLASPCSCATAPLALASHLPLGLETRSRFAVSVVPLASRGINAISSSLGPTTCAVQQASCFPGVGQVPRPRAGACCLPFGALCFSLSSFALSNNHRYSQQGPRFVVLGPVPRLDCGPVLLALWGADFNLPHSSYQQGPRTIVLGPVPKLDRGPVLLARWGATLCLSLTLRRDSLLSRDVARRRSQQGPRTVVTRPVLVRNSGPVLLTPWGVSCLQCQFLTSCCALVLGALAWWLRPLARPCRVAPALVCQRCLAAAACRACCVCGRRTCKLCSYSFSKCQDGVTRRGEPWRPPRPRPTTVALYLIIFAPLARSLAYLSLLFATATRPWASSQLALTRPVPYLSAASCRCVSTLPLVAAVSVASSGNVLPPPLPGRRALRALCMTALASRPAVSICLVMELGRALAPLARGLLGLCAPLLRYFVFISFNLRCSSLRFLQVPGWLWRAHNDIIIIFGWTRTTTTFSTRLFLGYA